MENRTCYLSVGKSSSSKLKQAAIFLVVEHFSAFGYVRNSLENPRKDSKRESLSRTQ